MIRFLQTPGKTKKIVLGGLLVVICGAMVITLVPGGILGDAFGFGAPQGDVLARVGDEQVTVAEVTQTANNMGRQQFPRGFPSQFRPFLMQRAADQLILQKAMISEAHRMGLRVTDEELRSELQHGTFSQVLFPNGTFVGQDAYENFVSQQLQLSVANFESLMKQDLLIRKLRAAVEGGIVVSDKEIADQYKRENTKVEFDYAVLTLNNISKQIKPTDADVKAYYEKNKQAYTNAVPERRSARYIVVDTAKLQQQVKVTPEELQSYYNQHRDEYRVPDQVNVRHILVKTPDPVNGKVDDKAVADAKAKAESILKQVQNGGNFVDLAKKNSDDPGSKENGGSLGWIQHGQTVAEFDQTAFSLKRGETSGLVRSSFGFHIIHVDDKQQAHVKTLDEVRAQIEPAIAAQKVAGQVDAIANKVDSEARAKGLDAAAKDNGFEVISAGPFTRSDSVAGLGNAPEFMSAVFGAQPKNPPDLVHIPNGSVIFQVTDIAPARTPSFDEIRARVETEYKSDQARQQLAKKTEELSEKARSEHDLKKAAKDVGADFKTSELVGLNSQVPDIGSLSGSPAEVVFDMKKGDISGPISTGRGGVVLSLLDKQEPPAEQMAASKDRLRDQLLEQKRNQYLQVFVDGLRSRMQKEGKIRINDAEMKKLTAASTDTGE
jgi:peptidyl-prolyl cis-trans isomerase D